MNGLKATLYILGGALEGIGILLVAWPDFGPILHGGWDRAHEKGRRARAWVGARLQRLFRRPRSVTILAPPAIATAGVPTRISAKVASDPNASIADKIDFLLHHADEAQERINDLDHRLTNESEKRHREIEQARQQTEERTRNEIRNALDRHKRLRLLGIALTLVGLGLLDAGNFA